MDNELREILMQLVDTTNKLTEGQKQLFEGQKRTDEHFQRIDKRLDNIENELAEIKEEAIITRAALNRQGDMLDQLVDFVNDFLPAEFKYDPNK